MKIFITTRACLTGLSLILLCSACQKENFSRNMVGIYTGLAVYRTTPDWNQPDSFPQCKIHITEIDRFTVKLEISKDPNDPSKNETIKLEVANDSTFNGYQSAGPRQPVISWHGVVSGKKLYYNNERSGAYPPYYAFIFQGHKD